MSQIRDGLVNVTKGSATVTGTNTEFTLASVGSLFIVSGDRVSYTIDGIVSDTQITLTSPYGGVTNSLVNYTIHTSLTPNRSYPYPTRSDIETATIVATAIKRIDADVTPFNYRGAWAIGISYSEKDMVVDVAGNVTSFYISEQNHIAATANRPPLSPWNLIFSSSDVSSIVFAEMHWRGGWVTNTQYYYQNVVRYGQSIYVATQDSLSPTFQLTDWEYLINIDELEQFKIDAQAAKVAAELAETNAGISATNALASKNKAEEWAEKNVDIEVELGKYSAKHYSVKAGNSATAAATSETNAGLSETAAGLSETNALASKNKAQEWAEKNVDIEVELGKYSAKHYSVKAGNSATAAATSETNAGLSETAAGLSETNALASKNKAQEWADKPLGQEVEIGKYSARHWAEQLGAVPNTAYNWRGTWVAGTYNAGDAVFHAPSRSAYITLVTTTHEPNIDGLSDWMLLARASQFSEAAFIDLDDTPINYTNKALGFLQVNLTANGIVFTQVPNDGKPYIVKNGEFVEWNWGL